jgi:hypothetical protein
VAWGTLSIVKAEAIEKFVLLGECVNKVKSFFCEKKGTSPGIYSD